MVHMDGAIDVLGIIVGALVSLALVMAMIFQWQDDHDWMHRSRP